MKEERFYKRDNFKGLDFKKSRMNWNLEAIGLLAAVLGPISAGFRGCSLQVIKRVKDDLAW